MSHLTLLVPLGAAAAAAMLAGYAWARRSRHQAHASVAEVACAVLVWAVCEVLGTAAGDAETALLYVRLSALGWMPLGPLLLRAFLSIGPSSRLARALPALFVVAAVFVALDLATPWLHPAVERQPWGWSYRVGPLFPVALVFVLGCIGLGLVPAARALRRARTPAERRPLRALLVGYLVPVGLASGTNGILPLLDVPAPPLGAASFVFTAGIVAWSVRRFGHSLAAPHDFTAEVLDSMRDGVALLRPDGRVRYANAAFGTLAETGPAALSDRSVDEWLDEPALVTGGELHERETELVGASGRRIPVAISTAAVRDREGHLLGVALGVRDLREVVALRRRVVTSSRLAAVGELAAGIAHEINNPLAYLRSNLGVLRSLLEDLADKPERAAATEEGDRLADGRDLVEESLEGTDRIATVVRDLRTLSGPSHAGRELVDLNRLLEAALRVLQPHLAFRVQVERRLAALPPVAGSPAELQHVFLALLLRAGRALEGTESGTIDIVTDASGGDAAVRIRDDGRGLPPELRERAFDPFFATAEGDAALGLDLSVAWQVVREHGGTLELESTPEGGTCVEIRLPAAP